LSALFKLVPEAISDRGGVLGAMDTMYQRGKVQEESLYYEHKKHDGSLPLIGVNTFLPKEHAGEIATEIELIRSTEGEKGQQIENVKRYGAARNALASDNLKALQTTARDRRNVFEQLVEAAKYNSLGQISHALYEVGGEYRRNM
jgi:methylmalonyl-CoA mutase